MGRGTSVLTVGGRKIEISNPDKILFPDLRLSKLDVARYYARIAPVMLPHVSGRLLTLRRFPDGIASEGFYQKNVSDYFPSWLKTVEVRKETGTVRHAVVEEPAALVFLASQATLELHVSLSRISSIENPDRLIFDLDPPDGGIELGRLRTAVRLIRSLLDYLGLPCFPMATGSSGYHVVVPLRPEHTFDETRTFARSAADQAASRNSALLTTEIRKEKRSGRIFVDCLRNAYGQTGIAAYSTRAKPGAPVATPIDWNELSRSKPAGHSLQSIHRRLAQKSDPWLHIDRHRVSLDAAGAALSRLRGAGA